MADTREERQLVSRVQAGSREAFEQLLDLYQDRVYSLVRRMVGEQDAEDVAQEALVEIWNSIGTFRGKSSLPTWVYRVAVNVCLEHRRRKRPEMSSIEDDFAERQADPGADPGAVAVKNEVRCHVEAAIRELPEIHRDVVVLHELQGLTYQECSTVLGCPVGTVKSRLSHAFGKMRELLRDYASESGVA